LSGDPSGRPHLIYERLAPDPTLCQNFSRDFRRSTRRVMSPLYAEIIAAANGYE